MNLFRTARLATALPSLCRDRFEAVHYHHVWADVLCARRDVFFFTKNTKSPVGPNITWTQLWLPGRGSMPRKSAIQALPLSLAFGCLLLFFFFSLSFAFDNTVYLLHMPHGCYLYFDPDLKVACVWTQKSSVLRCHIIRCTYTYVGDFFVLFRPHLFVRAPFAQTLYKDGERGRPSGHSLDAICAVCRAWHALKVFFPTGVDTTISRVFFQRRYFVPGILHFSKCWRLCSYVSL